MNNDNNLKAARPPSGGGDWCRLGCALFVGMLAPQPSLAQSPGPPRQVVADGPVEMSIELDRVEARIADPIMLRIQVDAPRGTMITFPVVNDTFGQFSVINLDTIRDLPLEGVTAKRRWTATLELESLESGQRKIPPLEVLYRLPDSFADAASPREGSLKSKPISIQVISVLEESEQPTQFRDIKDTAELPLAEVARPSRIWFAIGAALLACVAAGLVLWSRRGQRPPPARWALAEIDQIESGYEQKTVDAANAYARLSTVLREYLEAELAFPATSLSSEELVSEMSDSSCSDAAKQRLQQFVVQSDQLKFSGRQQMRPEYDESPFDSVRVIIRETSDVSIHPVHQERS